MWSLYKNSERNWEDYLKKNEAHYRQSYYWGELKKEKKWKVLRLEYKNKNQLLETRVQVLYKKFFFIYFFFIPGGVIGNVRNLDFKFIEFLKKEINSKFLYLRLDDSSFKDENINFYKTSLIWKKPNFRMHDSVCSVYNFMSNISDFNKDFTRDFRSSVKSSFKKNNIYKIEKNPNIKHLTEISESMFKNKKIKMMDSKDFENLVKHLGIYASFYISYSNEGQPIAYRTVLTIGDKSWDLAAATSYNGRKLFAGFGVVNEVLKNLYLNKIKNYDLGAILLKNSGINSFKLGTGAKALKYVGEYEYSGSKFINYLTNILIKISFSKTLQLFFVFRRLYL